MNVTSLPWFGVPEGAATRLVAVVAFDGDNTLALGRSEPVIKSYPALVRLRAARSLAIRKF